MKDIEIVLQGSIDRLLSAIWETEDYDCINIFKHSETEDIVYDYFDLCHLKQLMSDPDAEYNAVYVLVILSKEQEEKYLTLINLLGNSEVIKIIYEEYENNPTLEY